MLQARSISLQRGDRVLYDAMSWTVHGGQHVGIVGRNGVGKSTLFDLILGRLTADSGELAVPEGWRLAWMAQQVAATGRSALDHVLDGHEALRQVQRELAEAEARDDPLAQAALHARLADEGGYEAEARAGEILHGLGFAPDDFHKAYRAFSGGWRIRLNLARALMAPADALLLDEPTNHLDLDTSLWLEGWLKRYPGTLLIIAHDRDFLDGVADHIIHLHDHRATLYRGNYSSFERQRAEQLALQAAAHKKQQAQIAHLEKFVARFRYKESKARQAQSRLKALERMTRIAPVHADSPYRFEFPDPERMSNPLVNLRDVAIGYGSTPVLTGVSQTLLPGARIGILGANGAGKSTLLKCLVGELEPQSGDVSRGNHARIGYFAQHQLETLDAGRSALAHVQKARPGEREQWCRNLLGGWGFDAELAERPAGTLSGGEKARLVLVLISLARPAILVLDEPTNHLDLDMREALSLALQSFSGALLLVAHDRNLLRATVDEFWVVRGGRVTPFDASIEDYTDALRSDGAGTAGPTPSRGRGKAERQQAAARRAALKPLRDDAGRWEREAERLGARLSAVEGRLADPEIYQGLPAEELDALLAEAGTLRRRRDEAEERWLEAADALERAERDG